MTYKPSPADMFVLAQTIYGEERGESYQGKCAVAWVVKNRALRANIYISNTPHTKQHPLFGDGTVASACRMPMQFSCWNDNDPNSAVLKDGTIAKMWDLPQWRECLHAALTVLMDREADCTGGSAHYYADTIDTPKWAAGLHPYCTIGHHRFFNDVR